MTVPSIPSIPIDVEDDDAVYYYHFDGLGSIIALSDDQGDTVQTYKYGVFGQVAAEDTDHPNPYMFTGRRYDKEIGLYYYRARYYNPYIGRFLQTDPVGYEAGMNLYKYCMNNPLNRKDPHGERSWLYGAGHITIDTSCNNLKICVLPEDGGEWNCSPLGGKTYEADAIGFYDINGNPDGLKCPDNCHCTIFCEPNDVDDDGVVDQYDVSYKYSCRGVFASPSRCTPGDPNDHWPPPLPPKEDIEGVIEPDGTSS